MFVQYAVFVAAMIVTQIVGIAYVVISKHQVTDICTCTFTLRSTLLVFLSSFLITEHSIFSGGIDSSS